MELLHQPEDIIAQRYRIIDILGQGGSGTTYQAQDIQSGERVALKALSLHRMSEWKMLELFEREARILEQLEHPAIPRYLNYFCVDTPEDRCFYIVQQLAPGKSLAAWVMSGWRTNEGEVRHTAIQILSILVYLHSLTPPVLHRDIKPQNIIRQENGQVFLVDFGAVANTYHNTFMRGSTVVGTYGYMAPEQFRGQAVPTTDLYGLGATLLFLLTHRSPAELPTDRLKIDFRSRVQISSEFADWLEKMLQPDTEDRFSSAKEALAVLRSKQLIIPKLDSALPWKAIVGLGIAAVTTIFVFNSFKYNILGYLGLTPTEVYKAIEEAVTRGDINTVRKYLEQGVNADVRDNETGTTLLQNALVFNKVDIVQLLLAKGADVKAKNKNGITPLHSMQGLMLQFEMNSFETGNYSSYIQAEHSAHKMAQMLIAKGADVNAKDNEGKTPLSLAVVRGSKDMAELLIAKGADLNAKDNEGKTPLSLALQRRFDVSHQSDEEKYTFYVRRLDEIARMLIARGADINTKDKYGKTPLDRAIESDSNELVELLISKGSKSQR